MYHISLNEGLHSFWFEKVTGLVDFGVYRQGSELFINLLLGGNSNNNQVHILIIIKLQKYPIINTNPIAFMVKRYASGQAWQGVKVVSKQPPGQTWQGVKAVSKQPPGQAWQGVK